MHGDVDTPRGLRPHVISRESLVVRSDAVFAGDGVDVGGGVLERADLSEFVVGAEVRVCELASARVFDAFALELALGNLATHGPGGVGDGVVEPRGASPVELPGAKVAEAQAAREARLVGGSAAHLAQDDELRAGVEVQPEALEVVEEGVLAAARARVTPGMYRNACSAASASYAARRAGSPSVSNAARTAAKARASPPLSGWCVRAAARYAARTCAGVASRRRSSAS